MVGCGNMSRVWFRAIQEIEDLEMVGLVDLVEENAARRAAEYRLQDAMVGVELKAVLESTRPEVVFDCTAPEAHAEVALEALEHGCHVLGEKPLADSMEKARMVVEASERAGRIYAVIQNRRYDPNIRRLRRLLEAGEIGPITTVNSDFYIGAHFGGFRDHMEHVLLLDMAIHTFDATRLLTAADPLSVYCREWNPAGSWYDRDASAVAVFEMTGGIVYTYHRLYLSWQLVRRGTADELGKRMAHPRGRGNGAVGRRGENSRRGSGGAAASSTPECGRWRFLHCMPPTVSGPTRASSASSSSASSRERRPRRWAATT